MSLEIVLSLRATRLAFRPSLTIARHSGRRPKCGKWSSMPIFKRLGKRSTHSRWRAAGASSRRFLHVSPLLWHFL